MIYTYAIFLLYTYLIFCFIKYYELEFFLFDYGFSIDLFLYVTHIKVDKMYNF